MRPPRSARITSSRRTAACGNWSTRPAGPGTPGAGSGPAPPTSTTGRSGSSLPIPAMSTAIARSPKPSSLPSSNCAGRSWRAIRSRPGACSGPRLAQAGIGLWPDFTAPVTGPVGTDAVLAAQRDLARIGYDTRQSGRLDTTTTAVITAFQRHWRPGNCDGALDAETARHIAIRAKAAGASAI